MTSDFRHRPFEQQKEYLLERLTQQTLPELILLCSTLPDSTPLIFLMKQAQARGVEVDASLGKVLLQLSTSALQKLLELPGLLEPVFWAWQQAEVEQLVSFALLDRYLRRGAPERWQEALQDVANRAEVALKNGESADPHLILRLQGREQKRLQELYADTWRSWTEAWKENSQQAIHHLAARPRGVSLANAEKLLSQQVYTDQGHFLLELLQNADDAGATEFEVRFASDSVTVIHNGVPFDFRDLVGVLSIGQTTKTERQIGYFGVGFKSVFEVTERPRIASGHFSFEIIDISIPRYLPSALEEPGRTVLVLPLKDGLTVEPYYQRALAIQETLLLNLPNVRTLRWTGPDGIETCLSQSRDGDFFRLSRDGVEETYLVWKGDYEHTGWRPDGKPKEATVMLAFPQVGEVTEQNLFSFLPIQESSGLKFLIGSHFDVPVDRERLDQTSAWNRGLISSIPKIVEQGCRQSPELVLQLLTLLPLPDDPVAPLFASLSGQLAEVLRSLPFLPGDKVAAKVSVLDAELMALFEPDERDDFVVSEDERLRNWLVALGAKTYDLRALLLELARGRPPKKLATKNLEAWVTFHKLLLQSPSFETWERKLQAVPLFPDNSGELVSAQALCQVPEEWVPLFVEAPRTVWDELLANSMETDTLVAALRVRTLDWKDLLEALQTKGLENFHPQPLIEELVKAPKPVQMTFFRLPLFTSLNGEKTSLAAPHTFAPGALVTESGTPTHLFGKLKFCTQSQLIEPLLEAYGWPRFDRSRALRYASISQWKPTDTAAAEFRAWLLQSQSEWATIEDLETLVRLPIFESSDGPLMQLHDLWDYEQDELSELLPELPQLLPGSTSQRLVEHFGLKHRLGQADLVTLIDEFETEDAVAALELLSTRAQSLSREQISRLLSRPLVDGRPIAHPDDPYAEQPLEVAESTFVTLFQELGLEVADVSWTKRLGPLMEAAGFPRLGLKRLVEVLREKTPPAALLPAIYEVLIEKNVELHLGYSLQVVQELPLWECVDGGVRSTNQIPPNDELAALFEVQNQLPQSHPPEELFASLSLLEPLEFVVNFVRQGAAPNEALSAQPSWLNTVPKVDAVSAHLTKHVLCVDSTGVVRDSRLFFAPAETYTWLPYSDLLHPESSQEQVNRAYQITAIDILDTFLPRFEDKSCREALYSYLQAHLGQVVREEEARQFLLTQPIWLSAGGEWRRLEEMVLESGLPDMGFDWYPHPEIPEPLLEQLKDTLDVGRPDPSTLFSTLLPAYREKLHGGQQVDELLQLMSKITQPLTGQEVRQIVAEVYSGGEFPVAPHTPISAAYAPPPGLSALSGAVHQRGKKVSFLRKLGLPYLPSVPALRICKELATEDAEALEELVSWVWEERPDDLEGHLEFLSQWQWLPTKAGDLRAPVQLYTPTSEVEELIGASPSLYPRNSMPLSLWRALGVKDESEVEFPQALSFLKTLVAANTRVGSSFYYYLENCLQEGLLSPQFLAASLAEILWIWTDEAEYRSHTEVLGFPAYRYFGPYRGTWERANSRFPSLSRFFDIPEELNSETILQFFAEVAQGRHIDCPQRLLMNGLAFLSTQGAQLPTDWKLLPARQFPTLDSGLVAAAQSGVFRSNSPTLAALFGQGGPLWVVDTDHPEHGEELEHLYAALGVPKLREAYTVEPHDSGQDVTQLMPEEVGSFRELLRSIHRVLPRLRAARPEWSEGEWLADQQLKPFTSAGAIRVIDGLQLLYDLPGVSTVLVTAALAYDPDLRRMLVSADAVKQPRAYALDLAEGLSECIYQGPGSENLVDLLNLLLLFGEEGQMNAYLDQRHFPRPFEEEETHEPWRKKLGEILDYGLHQVLARRFPELKDAQWDRWRDADWAPTSISPRALLSQIGISNPSSELEETLEMMMESEELILPSQEGEVPVVRVEVPTQQTVTTGESPEQKSVFGRFRQRLAEKLTSLRGGGKSRTSVALQKQLTDMSDAYRHPPESHLLYSESNLQGHDRYCLELFCTNFNSATQEYVEGWSDWQPIFLPTGKTVQFSGSLTIGNTPIPMPLYSRFAEQPTLSDAENKVVGPDKFGRYKLKEPSSELELSYNVELSGVPEYRDFTALTDFDPRLIATTVMLDQLPPDLRKWIDWAKNSKLPHWQLADRATEFVRASYKYDLSYLENEAAQAVVNRPFKRGENRFLELLHAGADSRYLGRGVCGELSAILLELLRHCGVPSAIASGWALDEGLIHVPDHVIPLALISSEAGAYWLPLEPSMERMGHRESAMPEINITRLELLEKAASILMPHLEGIPSSGDRRQRFLQDRLLGLFGHSDLLELYLEVLAAPERLRKEITPDLRELHDRGFLDIASQELYAVRVRT